jgi:S-adenosylmethionine:tRNA ribosyltransferase-isomerase
MRLDAFDYHLPESLIAQKPLDERPASRLMIVERAGGRRTHGAFRDLPSLLEDGDVLVLNRSRVLPARLFVRRASGGRVELFVVKIEGDGRFRAIGTPLRRLRPGDEVSGEDFSCRIVGRIGEREVRVEVRSGGTIRDILERHGHVPLPPYIQREDVPSDRERYQTVFADEDGSVAAPTAGLHFDERLLADIARCGVRIEYLVLHVGLGTFLPLEHDAVEDNVLHSEEFTIDSDTIEAIRQAKTGGRRVVAVGTTVTRVLEAVWKDGLHERIAAGTSHTGATGLFIYPGFRFRVVDALVTNFHLPRSSLLLLVSAFLGRETTLSCYEEAVREKYRFYSYGDAMFIR